MNGRASMPQIQMTLVLFAHHVVLIGLAQGKFVTLGTSFTLKFLLRFKVFDIFPVAM